MSRIHFPIVILFDLLPLVSHLWKDFLDMSCEDRVAEVQEFVEVWIVTQMLTHNTGQELDHVKPINGTPWTDFKLLAKCRKQDFIKF